MKSPCSAITRFRFNHGILGSWELLSNQKLTFRQYRWVINLLSAIYRGNRPLSDFQPAFIKRVLFLRVKRQSVSDWNNNVRRIEIRV